MNLFFIRIWKLLHALTSAMGRRALRFGVAASVEHSSALGNIEYRTVVDVGANVGQFALFIQGKYPRATVFSFEPLSECWSTFADIFGDNKEVQLFRCGIGAADEDAAINVTSENDSSSILAPAAAQIEAFGTRISASRKIELRRLASVLSGIQLIAPALLKIDVQGYELEVLKGCQELLPLFDAVYVEASYVELYEDQALAGDVIEFLRVRDFVLAGVFNQYVNRSRGPLQADFLFMRALASTEKALV